MKVLRVMPQRLNIHSSGTSRWETVTSASISDNKVVLGNELVESVRHDPGVVMIGNGAGRVEFVVVTVDLSVQVVVHDCV